MKEKLIISFSGGRTSAYMTWWLLNCWQDRDKYDIIVVFANTGKEVEGTYFFIDECAQEWGIDIVWVEAVPISAKGWKVKAKVVTYETASRKGEPFEAMIKKLGIPSSKIPFCSPQLKRQAVRAYAKQIGWVKYSVAIGYRTDEPKRVNRKNKRQKLIYPLVDINPKSKKEISEWWSKQPFNLDIHVDDGNCDNCWKKNAALLCRNMQRNPASFTWWESIGLQYGQHNPRDIKLKPPYNFFRGNMSVQDIRELSLKPQSEIKQLTMFEPLSSCGESCEAW